MNTLPRPNWWSRNWKWLLPSGCLGLLVLFVAVIFGFISLVFGVMKSSDVYRQAVARADRDPTVIAALGEPISEGRFVTGGIKLENDSGNASLTIPLSGPKGAGKLYVEATKVAGAWQFQQLVFEDAQNHQRTDLAPNTDKGERGGD